MQYELKSPSALHIRPDDVLLVSDLDLQSVIALRLSMNLCKHHCHCYWPN